MDVEEKIEYLRRERQNNRSWRDISAEVGVSHSYLIKFWRKYVEPHGYQQGYHPPMTINRIEQQPARVENSGNLSREVTTGNDHDPMTNVQSFLELLGPRRRAKAEALIAFLKQNPGSTKKEIQLALGLRSKSDAWNIIDSIRPLIREEVNGQNRGEKRYFLR